MRQCTLWKR